MILDFISSAALLVKVMARIDLKSSGCAKASFRYSFTRVNVLPEPADDLNTLSEFKDGGLESGKKGGSKW